jgi:hypothetical protein
MSNVRTPVAFAALCILVGCAPATSSNDAGPADTGVTTPVDSGTPVDAGPGPVDSGTPMDAGPMDAGPHDAGSMYGPLSCEGVANCVENLGFSVANATECEKEGTRDAGIVFTQLVGCAEGCGAFADAGGCLAAITADGGACATQWVDCQNQGVGCGTIVGCIQGLTVPTQSALAGCIGEGTDTAIGLSQTLVGCEAQVCADAGSNFQACGAAAVDPDGGPCYSSLVACVTDQSAMP